MPRKIYKPEEIIAKLRQVEVLTSQGQVVIDAVRSIGVTDATYYRWRQEYGGLKGSGANSLTSQRSWLRSSGCDAFRLPELLPRQQAHVDPEDAAVRD